MIFWLFISAAIASDSLEYSLCMSKETFCDRYSNRIDVPCNRLIKCHYPIAEGAYGRVCAFNLDGKPHVFKKMLHSKRNSRSNAKVHALNELRKNKELQNTKGVITSRNCVYGNQFIGIVMENGGDDWGMKMADIFNMPLAEQAYLYSQAGLAISALHTKGVAHGDIKPENILLSPSTPPRVWVIDIGSSCAANEVCRVATKEFAGPERHIKAKSYTIQSDYRIDSWSFAMVLFAVHTKIGGKKILAFIDSNCWDVMTEECYNNLMTAIRERLQNHSRRIAKVILSGLTYSLEQRKYVYEMTTALQKIYAKETARKAKAN